MSLAVIDVIAERSLARGLTAELGIPHESPQALVLRGGELSEHAAHDTLTAQWFTERVAGGCGS